MTEVSDGVREEWCPRAWFVGTYLDGRGQGFEVVQFRALAGDDAGAGESPAETARGAGAAAAAAATFRDGREQLPPRGREGDLEERRYEAGGTGNEVR